MSDRHVGLLSMVREHFPRAEHWFCGRHLVMNTPALGSVGNEIFWRAAKATRVNQHKQAMAELRRQVCFM
jgi:hypothetical protein